MSRYTAGTSNYFTSKQKSAIGQARTSLAKSLEETSLDDAKEKDDARLLVLDIMKELHELSTEIASYSFE